MQGHWLLAVVLLLAGGGLPTAANEQLESDDIASIPAKADELAKRFGGAAHVLVVFDIDNTLLASEQILGSDQWFTWQAALLEHAPESKYLIADDIDTLVRLWSSVVTSNLMRLTQESVPATVQELGTKSFLVLILSARSPDLYDATSRSLRLHSVNVARFALPVRAPAARFNPFEGFAIDQEFTASERVRLRKLRPAPVQYADGICLCGGQNKGVILRLLLRRAQSDVKAVLFVDDQETNTNAVFDALRGTPIDVTTVRFTREDDRIQQFLHGDKQRVHRQWRRFQARHSTDQLSDR